MLNLPKENLSIAYLKCEIFDVSRQTSQVYTFMKHLSTFGVSTRLSLTQCWQNRASLICIGRCFLLTNNIFKFFRLRNLTKTDIIVQK